MKITPLGNLVLIEPIQETEMRGIAIPEQMQEANFGYVRAIGPGKDGIPIPLNEGDKVMLAKQAIWEEVKVEVDDGVIMTGTEMRLVNANHILAIMLPEGPGKEIQE